MASVVVNGDTSGAVTLSAPAVAGTVTVTLPAASGTMLTTASTGVVTQAMLSTNVAGNGPAFSAYNSNTQTFSAGTATKIVFNTEEFDTNSNFDSTTNYRFTPTVAGYYQVNGGLSANTQVGYFNMIVYKNGSSYKNGSNYAMTASFTPNAAISALVYCNGSTDYVELYGQANNGFTTFSGSSTVYFQAAMVRSA